MSRRAAHFKIAGYSLDMASGQRLGTVTIKMVAGQPLMIVRPHRRRRTYELPLAGVASMMVHKILKAEDQERRAAKRKRRRTVKRK